MNSSIATAKRIQSLQSCRTAHDDFGKYHGVWTLELAPHELDSFSILNVTVGGLSSKATLLLITFLILALSSKAIRNKKCVQNFSLEIPSLSFIKLGIIDVNLLPKIIPTPALSRA